jgi:hypothetical protein
VAGFAAGYGGGGSRFGVKRLFAILLLVSVVSGQSIQILGLPTAAVVIERAEISPEIRSNRELVLWMLPPEKHDRGVFLGNEPYTCPEETLSSYYSGPTRVSLIDTSARRPINTIEIRHEGSNEDSFDIPYRILSDFYYSVPGHPRGSEGKPELPGLHDFNGDGLSLESAFLRHRHVWVYRERWSAIARSATR